MKLFINTCLDPYFNLASEEYLIRNTDEDIILLWRNSPSVIIGKNQNAFSEINFAFTEEHDIAVVRRLTGGGAVFHDPGNVNFTFISPPGGSFAGGIREGGLDFAYFAKPITDALRGLGVDAGLSGRNDIVVHTDDGDRKISGNAQCVLDGVTMHHGTLLYRADMSGLQGALNVDPAKLKSKGIASVRSRVANIYDLLPVSAQEKMPDAEAFVSWLSDCLSEKFGVKPEGFSENVVAGISRLAGEKYRTDEWNLRRLGSFDTLTKKRFPFGGVEISMTVKDGVIDGLVIGGDFFGVRDVHELAIRLTGCVYSREKVAAALADFPVGECISGAEAKDIVGIMFDIY